MSDLEHKATKQTINLDAGYSEEVLAEQDKFARYLQDYFGQPGIPVDDMLVDALYPSVSVNELKPGLNYINGGLRVPVVSVLGTGALATLTEEWITVPVFPASVVRRGTVGSPNIAEMSMETAHANLQLNLLTELTVASRAFLGAQALRLNYLVRMQPHLFVHMAPQWASTSDPENYLIQFTGDDLTKLYNHGPDDLLLVAGTLATELTSEYTKHSRIEK